MSDTMFKRRRLNEDKLLSFGFCEDGGSYIYTTDIAGGQFRMTVVAASDGAISTKVVESESNEEYVLHRASGASGSFVGTVRADYEDILCEISRRCFEPDVFKSDYARSVIHYVRNTYHDELEFLWQRFPNNAVFRRKDTGKWYCALLVLSKGKLGLDSDEVIDILDLRTEPENIGSIVDGKRYFPGYHMNKKHWYTICLDGSVPIDEILRCIDVSYQLS